MWQDLIKTNYSSVESKKEISEIKDLIDLDKPLFVFKDKTILGIVTKKSYLVSNLRTDKVSLSTIAISLPYITKDFDDVTLAKMFVTSGLSDLAVFDKKKVIGYVNRTDFLKNVVAKEMQNELVGSIASTDLIIVNPNDLISNALHKFREYHISKLLVFDSKLRGVLTHTIILNYFNRNGKSMHQEYKNIIVKTVMKPDAYTVGSNDTVKRAIDLFDSKNTSSLIVIGPKEGFFGGTNVYGIVTKTDILSRYIAKFKEDKLEVHVSSKMDTVDDEVVAKKLKSVERLLSKGSKVFVHLKQGKEKFRGLSLVSCRIRVVDSGKSQNISAEGWGLEHAIELVIAKLKRRLTDHGFD